MTFKVGERVSILTGMVTATVLYSDEAHSKIHFDGDRPNRYYTFKNELLTPERQLSPVKEYFGQLREKLL